VECVNEQLFHDLADARTKIEAWRIDYNENRPLNQLTPAEFAENYKNQLTEKHETVRL
jgi:putative transposase